MASVLETITELNLDPEMITGLQTELADLASAAGNMPTASINNIVSLSNQIVLPDQNDIFGSGLNQLMALVDSGLRSPDELWESVSSLFATIQQQLDDNIQAPVANSLTSIRNISEPVSGGVDSLFTNLSGPLQQVADSLGTSEELQSIRGFIVKVQELNAQIDAAPDQISALIAEQIQGAMQEATSFVSPIFSQLNNYTQNIQTQVSIENLTDTFNGILLQLTPQGETSIASAIDALDFSVLDEVAAIDAKLRVALSLTQNFSNETQDSFLQGVALIETFNVDAWGQRLISAANINATSEITDIESFFAQWKSTLLQANDVMGSLSLDQVMLPLQELVDQIEPTLNEFDVGELKNQLVQGIESLSLVVNSVNQAQVDVLARFQGVTNNINQTVDSIQLDSVAISIDNAISSIDPTLTEIENLIDSVSLEIQGGLTDLQTQLNSLKTKLTDPAGEYRTQFEGFLNSVRDAVPDDIPQTLEGIGEQLGESVSGLENIALDPVFDEVVSKLEEMRDELKNIDAGSLGPILEAALTAALAVIKSFDYQSEVEDFLTEKFDQSIAVVDAEAIQVLQDQVDGILVFIESYKPSTLFETIGIDQAYDEMATQINNFRPSQGLSEIIDSINSTMDQLESMTPTQVLQPITAPLDQVKVFVQSLSLEPLVAQLQQSLEQINNQLSQFDIGIIIEDISTAVNQLREQLQNAISIDSLLDIIRPIYEAVVAAAQTVNPQMLLVPLTDLRTKLNDGIDAVDVSELTAVFASIANTINSVSLPQVRVDLQEPLQVLSESVEQFNLADKFNQLQSIRQSVIDALEARGEQADEDMENSRQALIGTINSLDPLPLLASSLEQYQTFKTGLLSLASDLENLMQDGGYLELPLQALSEKVNELAPAFEEGVDDVKDGLKNIINQAFEASGVDQINEIYIQLMSSLESYSPENLQALLDELVAPLNDAIESLLNPADVLNEVEAEFNNLTALINPGLGDFINQIQSQLQPILDTITEKVNSLNPDELLAPLDEKYAQILLLKDRLQLKIQQLVESLDAPYETVVEIVDELDPMVVLAEPLDSTYQQILDKVTGIDISLIFEPLFEALRVLRDALIEGIKRTGTAFESFLSASPSGGSAASVSI